VGLEEAKAKKRILTREEFVERLKELRKELGPPIKEFSLTEETFSASVYVFDYGYPYLWLLEHYHDVALDEHYYWEMFLTVDWLKEIVERARSSSPEAPEIRRRAPPRVRVVKLEWE